jgi:signal transduction histidine kinase
LLIFWDITERKAAARQLEAQAVELRGLNQMKSRILSIIAHDLRSPLAGLTSMLEIADAGMLSEEEFRELIPMISRSVDDASALLENLLTWSLGQLDGQLIRRERFDLSILAGADLPPFEKKASDKGVQLVNRLTEGAWVDADRNMISLVVRNLVGNAVKFCRRDDRITLETRAHEGALILTVTDTGVGMKPEVLRQLFGFDLVSQLGTEQERGTGLGLKLCHDFVLKNGGEIWAESELGKGSRFHVRLKSGL